LNLSVAIPRGLFREVDERPRGYRHLKYVVQLSATGLAVQVRYYRWLLWVPIKAVAIAWPSYELFVNGWAVDSSKEHRSAKCMEE
jgi:hypothetical protein